MQLLHLPVLRQKQNFSWYTLDHLLCARPRHSEMTPVRSWQKHFRASDAGGKMSSVETADYVSSDHFLGAGIDLDSIGEQVVEVCPSCANGGTKMTVQGSVAAPFVAVLVGSSQVKTCSASNLCRLVAQRLVCVTRITSSSL